MRKVVYHHEYIELVREFFKAMDQNDNETSLRLLDEGVSLNNSCPRFEHERKRNVQPYVYPVGLTPLMLAIRKNNRFMFDHLIERGADIFCGGYKADMGEEPEVRYIGSPLHFAVAGKPDMVTTLLDLGVPPDYRGRNDYITPLADACAQFRSSSMPCIKILVDRGADIKQLSKNGDSLLHYAMELGTQNKELLEYLIKSGLDIYQKNKKGRSVFDLEGPFNPNFQPQFDESMKFLKEYRKNLEENTSLDNLINTDEDGGDFLF